MKKGTKKISLMVLLIFCVAYFVSAQVKKSSVKRAAPVAEKSEHRRQFPVFQSNEYDFYLTIDKDFNTRLAIQLDAENDVIGRGKALMMLNRFFIELPPQKVSAAKENPALNERNIYIKPDASLKYAQIQQVIKSVEGAGMKKIALLIPTDDYPTEVYCIFSATMTEVKPRPLFLLVNAGADGKLDLNREDVGNLNDLSKLENLLRQVFKERENNGVFRYQSSETETDVVIQVAPNTEYNDVIKLVKSLVKTGANPIGILVDPLILDELSSLLPK